jgi:hypothetical protein
VRLFRLADGAPAHRSLFVAQRRSLALAGNDRSKWVVCKEYGRASEENQTFGVLLSAYQSHLYLRWQVIKRYLQCVGTYKKLCLCSLCLQM